MKLLLTLFILAGTAFVFAGEKGPAPEKVLTSIGEQGFVVVSWELPKARAEQVKVFELRRFAGKVPETTTRVTPAETTQTASEHTVRFFWTDKDAAVNVEYNYQVRCLPKSGDPGKWSPKQN